MQLSTLARSRFLPRYGYQLVPHHSNEADESGSSKMIGFLSSRRFRVVLLVAILLVLAIFLMYGGPHLPSVTLTASPTATPPARPYKIDWSRFAYVQYITNSAYLCNSVMIFESLKRLGSKAQRVMMYPEDWNPTGDSQEGRLLTKAKEKYDAHLIPIQVQHSSDQEATWIESFTKLLAFNQTQYDRVISLDSDATVLQAMDELFFLPPSPIAMPRAYWLNPKDHVLSSQLMVVQPSELEFGRIMQQIHHHDKDEFDMEIVNNLYGESCIIIPHRPYDLLTGEFHKPDHHAYLGSREESWDPEKVINEAKFLHFSDWPYPKPWIYADEETTHKYKPRCYKNESSGLEDDCRDQQMWLWFYKNFSRRRDDVCGKMYGKRMTKLDAIPVVSPSPWEPIF